MSRKSLFYPVTLTAAIALGCSASSGSPSLGVGTEGAGGAGNGSGGAGTIQVDDGGLSNVLSAHIERNHVTVTIVTLKCAGDCADVVAVPTGGYAPYSFAWEDGSTNPARTMCPTATTAYEVSVTDTGSASSEFKRAPQTATAPLTAEVLECPRLLSDGGATDGGAICTTAAPSLQPGKYAGDYTAHGTSSNNGNFPDAGPFTLTLTKIQDGDGGGFVSFAGTVDFLYGPPPSTLITIHGDVTGQLDCDGTFTGKSVDATWTALGVPVGTGDVTFTGRYDLATATLAGPLTMSSAAIGGDGVGTWTGTLAP